MKPRHKNKVWRVALNAGGSLAASASEDGKVKVWDVTNEIEFPVADAPNPGKHGSMGVVFVGDTLLYTLDGDSTKLLDKKAGVKKL